MGEGTFLIIRGPLGVGKTVVARLLAQRLGGEYISVDGLLEEHGLDQMGPEDECIPAVNFIRASEIALPRARAALESGRPVVFDGNFYHREPIEHLKANLPAQLRCFTLQAPLEVCIARDAGRERVYGEDAAGAVHWLVSRFDYGTRLETAGKTAEEVVEEIEFFLGDLRGATA